ncbi:kelch-like protein 3 [Asterias amurensis]|uniref:kelch-like protein 3 n=1 Tax=Asterias amurensis TaxID=7602 RepID=UPI003AB24D8D
MASDMDWQPGVSIKTPKMDGSNDDAEGEGKKSGRKTCRKFGALANHMKSFFNQPELSDVLIRCGDIQYRSHRLILSAWSPVFEDRLAKGSKPAKGGDCKELLVIDVDPGISVDSGGNTDINGGLSTFLNFLYSGKADLTETTVKVIMNLAQEYKIQPLQELCEQFIGKEIGQHSVDKALEWLAEAEKKSLVLLQENCMKVLRAYFQYIPDVSWQVLRLDQMISIIESSEVVVEDEYALFSRIDTWIDCRGGKEEHILENLEKILPHIRFSNMTIWQLKQIKKTKLGLLISTKHPEVIIDALQARALASEETDFLEVSEQCFVPPRLYLKYVSPGGKLSSKLSSKRDSTDLYTRIRCSNSLTAYSDHRATVWRAKKGIYQQEDRESWEVRVRSAQENKGSLWRLQFLVLPSKDHINKKIKLALSIKIKEDVLDPIIIVFSGVVAKGGARGAADGFMLFTPFTFEKKPEYVYTREAVYVD